MSYVRQRDFVGYGGNPPHPYWPNNSKIAVNFVVVLEEGAESCLLNGDHESATNPEITGTFPIPNRRIPWIESMFEYGMRAGFWRIIRFFEQRQLPVTLLANGLSLEKNPQIVAYLKQNPQHEIASHHWRWISYTAKPIELERQHIHQCVTSMQKLLGRRPVGWLGSFVSDNTRSLVVEEGGFIYDSDEYNDDLPYWIEVDHKPLLIVPYPAAVNDFRFTSVNPSYSSADDYFTMLKYAFDTLYEEGNTRPKMMNVPLHCRISGHPARAMALRKFLDYIQGVDHVWIATREQIARHWIKQFPYSPG